MNVQKRNDCAIYCLSSGPTIPEWLGDRARRNLSKKDESIRRRIELIQDFQMPSSSDRLVQSRDGRYVFAAGTYPPRIRCYDVHDLTMKFERYLNAGVVDMVMLSEDYGKIALLQDDRSVAFHAPYGAHESIRIPTFGRSMAYEPTTCELLLAAKGNSIYRVNLEEGRFSEPWTFETTGAASATCIAVDPSHPMASVGCDDGIVRFWDNRSPDTLIKPFLKLDVKSAAKGYGYFEQEYGIPATREPFEISCIAHDPSSLYIATGTAGGLVALYDIRSSKPLHIKEHKHGLPIHTVRFHSGSGMLLSGDEKIIKLWRYKAAKNITAIAETTSVETSDFTNRIGIDTDASAIGSVKVNIESNGKTSHFIVAGDETDPTGDRSGVLLCATDQPKMDSYYIPALGVAPKWCSFLESITEELEERDLHRNGNGAGGASNFVQDGQDETIYENYKFVSRDDLEKLGISNLVGTPLLRGYMHGFFMDVNLYNRVKAVANPFEYEEYQKKKLNERLAAKRASRIAPTAAKKKRNKATVNPDLAERLSLKAKDTGKSGQAANKVLSDQRFGGLFTNPDFEIDEEDETFKLRNPSGVAEINRKKNNMDSDEEDEGGEEVSGRHSGSDLEETIQDDDEDSFDSASESDDDGFEGGKVRGEAYEEMVATRRKKMKKNQQVIAKKKKSSASVMRELDNGSSAVNLGLGNEVASDHARRRTVEMNMPLAERFALEKTKKEETPVVRVQQQGGSKEASFVPKDTRKKMEDAAKRLKENQMRGKRKRRGVKDLGFKAR